MYRIERIKQGFLLKQKRHAYSVYQDLLSVERMYPIVSEPKVVSIRGIGKEEGCGYLSIHEVLMSDGTRRLFEFHDSIFSEEVDQMPCEEQGFEEDIITLQDLYKDYLTDDLDENDSIDKLYIQYFKDLIQEMKLKASIKQDSEGGYWLDVDGRVANLNYRNGRISFEQLLFKKPTIERSVPKLDPIPEDEQQRLISSFIRSSKRYDIGYLIKVVGPIEPTDEQRRQFIETDHLYLNAEDIRSLCPWTVKPTLRFSTCFGHSGYNTPDKRPEYKQYGKSKKRMMNDQYYWIELGDYAYPDYFHCQLALTGLFGLPPSEDSDSDE